MQDLMTFIFKTAQDKQQWILNLMVQGHKLCLDTVCRHLQTMGVHQKESAANRQTELLASGVVPKQTALSELEVSQKGVENCEIDILVQNM